VNHAAAALAHSASARPRPTYDRTRESRSSTRRTDCDALPPIINRVLTGGQPLGGRTPRGTIRMDGKVSLRDGTWRVEPGPTLLMSADPALRVRRRARLALLGTPKRPIRMCGLSADATSRRSLPVDPDAWRDSVLRNLTVGGAGLPDRAVVVRTRAAIDPLRSINVNSKRQRRSPASRSTEKMVGHS
jgi:hypothetical protein